MSDCVNETYDYDEQSKLSIFRILKALRKTWKFVFTTLPEVRV